MVGRTLFLQLLTAGVTIALARILSPADYGLFAIALSIQLAGQWLVELGLPAAIVRLPGSPSEALLSSVSGCVLALGAIAAGGTALIAFLVVPFLGGSSEVLSVIAVTAGALPLYAYRAVPMALLDRKMTFGKVAAVEVADTMGFNAFALIAAIAGFGVYSLAAAVPVGAFLGMVTAHRLVTVPAPRLSWKEIRPIIGFGGRVSVYGFLYLGRDLGFVSLIAVLGGASAAGFFSMAKRLFVVPTALAAAVSQVSYPLISKQLYGRSNQTKSIIGLTALACSLPLAVIVGTAEPLLLFLLGEEWLPTREVILTGSLALFLTASIASPVNSLFLAEGTPNSPIAGITGEILISFLAVTVLFSSLTEWGVGIAMSLGALTSVTLLLSRAGLMNRSALSPVVKAVFIAALAALVGFLAPGGDDLLGLSFKVSVVFLAWLLLTTLIARTLLLRSISLIRRVLTSMVRSSEASS